MANSTDILTSDETRVKIFTEGIKIDNNLPKYRIMSEKENDDSKKAINRFDNEINSFPINDNHITDLSSLNYETLKAFLIDEQTKENKDKFSITDFNLTMSDKMRDIVKNTSYYRNGRSLSDFRIDGTVRSSIIHPNPTTLWGTIKEFFNKKKEFKEEKKISDKFDVIKYFADIHLASEESKDKYVNRLYEYINCIGIAEKTGQIALKEKLFGQLVINKYESILYANGYDKLITEDVMVKLTKKAPKALSLTYIANYTRTIPLNIIKKKLELDELEIFDNYVILSYDPNGKSYAQTIKERQLEVEKAKDPILFGVIAGSNKLYYINDWVDEYCDLRLENIVDILGQEEVTKHYLTDKIK